MDDRELHDWVKGVRRYFHQHPELSFCEYNTQKKIRELLDGLGIENHNIAGTGVCGAIRGAGQGKTIVLRADMDALKIQEILTENNEDYLSVNEGAMHACGHDGHMAIVLGTARLLQKNRSNLNGNVRLIFQPAEETPPGGAVKVIEEGGLDGADAILGLHLFTNYSSGEILLKEGLMMASHCRYELQITGKPGHHFNPDATIDPIRMAAEFIERIHPVLREALPPTVRYVFGVGTIHGGSQFNQTPESVVLSGSYRILEPEYMPVVEKTMRTLMDELVIKYKKSINKNLPFYTLDIIKGYPSVENNPLFTKSAAKTLKKHFNTVRENVAPVLGSEDFAYYLQKKPGTFIFLGAGNKEKGMAHENHSNKFDIDEGALETGVKLMYTIATDFLNHSEKYIQNVKFDKS
ncbi:MAG: amidohydrolase [Prolixibacteraceae bacterium]|jgi:amidohydrolase|nr:amidohydrolase [Prolixibacteraceae bacterium]